MTCLCVCARVPTHNVSVCVFRCVYVRMCAGACVNAFVNCRKFRSRHPRSCADEFEINVSECVIKAGPKAPSPSPSVFRRIAHEANENSAMKPE